MRGVPWKIVRRGKQRWTRDGKYRVRAHFGMYWAAWRKCSCRPDCYHHPIRLPGGIAGTGFNSLRSIQAAIRTKYA